MYIYIYMYVPSLLIVFESASEPCDVSLTSSCSMRLNIIDGPACLRSMNTECMQWRCKLVSFMAWFWQSGKVLSIPTIVPIS